MEESSKWQDMLKLQALEAACTADGRHVDVSANIADINSAEDAIRSGAQGVGLLRTEFLYLGNSKPPSEEVQVEVYRKIFKPFDQRPVIVRTLDIGGDKPPNYIDFPVEQNPFLGWRGVRVCLDEMDLFKTQLRAILQASAGYRVMIMFPMICSVDELRRCKEIVNSVKAELRVEGKPFLEDMPIGVMVEIPAAVTIAGFLAEECDFLSLGTNDLAQYTLAVDRTNERVAGMYQPLHPAVLRLVKATIDAGHANGKWVGMCGEMAGMQKAIPVLLGLGLDEFSMAAGLIPEAKWLIRQLNDKRLKEIAEKALSFRTAREVDQYLGEILSEIKTAS
jgi:phosphotransferase system enzyme I (PtsI)